MLLLLWSMFAAASPLEWSVEAASQSTIDIELHLKDGPTLFRILSTDNLDRRNFGWRPDNDPREGTIAGEFPHLFLGPGQYELHYQSSNKTWVEPYLPETKADRYLPIMLPENATGVMALHHDDSGGGLDGFAFASSQNGVAFLPLDHRSGWQATPLSLDQSYEPQSIEENSNSLSFKPKSKIGQRRLPSQRNLWIRGILFPITLLLFIYTAAVARRTLQNRKVHLAALVGGAITGLYAAQQFLASPTQSILLRGKGFDDPPTSATLLWSITQSLPQLSEGASTFGFPEGHSWLIMGPSWLAYVICAPFTVLTNAVMAHNIGVIVFSALNFYSVWLLARSWKCHATIAWIAAIAATLSPVYLSEIDTLSLDRCLLFPIPLFLLAVRHITLQSEQPFKVQVPAIIGGGAALCCALLSQVYYGIYLAAAAPLLILPHLLSRHFVSRLKAFSAMGLLGFVLMLPLLLILQKSTQGTVYDEQDTLRDSITDVLSPIEPSKAAKLLKDIVQTGRRSMDSPNERLMAAASNSLYAADISSPAEYFYGAQFYWPLVLIALLVSRKRKDTLLCTWYVLVFCLLSLGPLFKNQSGSIDHILPYYFYHLYIPGFEQLKHPYRYIILAGMLSGIPIAMGFQGIMDRINKSLIPPALLALGLGLVFVRQAPPERNVDFHDGMPFLEYYWARFKSLPQFDIDYRWPSVPNALKIPTFQPLKEISGQTAVLFPFTEPLPQELYLATTQNHITLVNGPPHGSDPNRKIPSIVEENSALNQLAWHSGSDRLRRYLSGGYEESFEELKSFGIHHVIVFHDALPSDARRVATKDWLETHATKVASDEMVSVWTF
ncbi:MAG: hypothetical protein ACON4U_04070 [Myxococcota bacterium]